MLLGGSHGRPACSFGLHLKERDSGARKELLGLLLKGPTSIAQMQLSPGRLVFLLDACYFELVCVRTCCMLFSLCASCFSRTVPLIRLSMCRV